MWYEQLAFQVKEYYVSLLLGKCNKNTESEALNGMCKNAVRRLASILPIQFDCIFCYVKVNGDEKLHAFLRINENIIDPTIKQFVPDCEAVMFKEEEYPLEIVSESIGDICDGVYAPATK